MPESTVDAIQAKLAQLEAMKRKAEANPAHEAKARRDRERPARTTRAIKDIGPLPPAAGLAARGL